MLVIKRPVDIATPDCVKEALECLHEPAALSLNALVRIPPLAPKNSAVELRELLLDVIAEISDSGSPQDAESGRLLVNYYVKRVGSHEVIMERLRLTRPTYYRRLNRGYGLIAQELDKVSKFAIRFQ